MRQSTRLAQNATASGMAGQMWKYVEGKKTDAQKSESNEKREDSINDSADGSLLSVLMRAGNSTGEETNTSIDGDVTLIHVETPQAGKIGFLHSTMLPGAVDGEDLGEDLEKKGSAEGDKGEHYPEEEKTQESPPEQFIEENLFTLDEISDASEKQVTGDKGEEEQAQGSSKGTTASGSGKEEAKDQKLEDEFRRRIAELETQFEQSKRSMEQKILEGWQDREGTLMRKLDGEFDGVRSDLEEIKKTQKTWASDRISISNALQEIMGTLGELVDMNRVLEGKCRESEKERQRDWEEANHWRMEAEAWKGIAKQEMARREKDWSLWEQEQKQQKEKAEHERREQEKLEELKEREDFRKELRKKENEVARRRAEWDKEERIRVERDRRHEEEERGTRIPREQTRQDQHRQEETRHSAHRQQEDRHQQHQSQPPHCTMTAPRRMTDAEWVGEKEEREKRKRNLYVEGLGCTEKEAPQRLRELLWDRARIEVQVRSAQICGRGIILEMEKLSEKVEAIKARGVWRGPLKAEDDLTYREKEVQSWLTALKKEEEGRGKRVMLGHQKIKVNGIWWYWYDRAAELAEGEPRQTQTQATGVPRPCL